MKTFNIITKVMLATLVVFVLAVSCEESADISTDPIEKDTLFTFAPDHGYPGTSILITGRNTDLSDVETVSFGSIADTTFVVNTDNTIQATVPIGAKPGKVTLVKSNGDVLTSLTQFAIDDAPIPTIMEFTPQIVSRNDTVTITGSLLDSVKYITLGDVEAEILENRTPTMLQFIVPSSFETSPINMYYNFMTSYGLLKETSTKSSSELTLRLPSISSIEPELTELNAGDTLTIKGSMFSELRAVYMGDLEVPDSLINVISDTEMQLFVPTGATSGKLILEVRDGETESVESFSIYLPSISSFLPGTGDDISPSDRTFSLIGNNFHLVDSITMGVFSTIIEARTVNHLTFSVSGSAGGYIELHTSNGVVSTESPFLLYGDYWIENWDDTFVPDRLDYDQFDAVDNPELTTVNTNPIDGNYRKYTGVVSEESLARLYWREENNLFSLTLAEPQGVSLQFDMSYTELPANFINADGSVDIQLFVFTASRDPYGHTVQVNVPFEGAENWQHVTFDFTTLVVDGNLHDGAVPEDGEVGAVKPNDIRILSILFPASLETEAVGETINVNFDNVKFVISED